MAIEIKETADKIISIIAEKLHIEAATINPQSLTPVTAFGPALLEACMGSSFTFADQSTPAGLITTRTWDFGDGSPVSNQQNPSHTYTIPGNYTVTLSVTTGAGCSSSTPATHSIKIDTLPTASFTAAVDCSIKKVTFTNTSNGHGGTITEWTWDFDDGTGVHVFTDGNTFTRSFPSGGTHNISLTVKTPIGCSSTAPFTQSIAFGAGPVAAFTVDNPCQANGSATFTNTSAMSDGTLMTYNWDFGDGSSLVQITPAAPPAPITHTFATGGNYTVQLTATSSGGCIGNFSKQVAIVNIPAAHDSIINRNNLCSNLPVKLVNLSTLNGFGALTKVEVFWDYPDINNKTMDVQPVSGNAYTHQYPVFGSP